MPGIASHQKNAAPPWGRHYTANAVFEAIQAECAAMALPEAHQGDLDIDAVMLHQHFDPEVAWIWVLREYGTYLHPLGMTAWHTKAAACAASRTGEGRTKAFVISAGRFSAVQPEDLKELYRWDYLTRGGVAWRGKVPIAKVVARERNEGNRLAVDITMTSLTTLTGRDRIGLRLLAAEANVWANRVDATLDGTKLLQVSDALLATRPLEP